MTLVDTNVLIDLLGSDEQWTDWSTNALQSAGRAGSLIMSPIVYGELAPQFPSLSALETFVTDSAVTLVEPTRAALYRAGRAMRDYRHRGGTRARLLPDFLIGAQAEDLGCAVLTRDPSPFRTYFPSVRLITP